MSDPLPARAPRASSYVAAAFVLASATVIVLLAATTLPVPATVVAAVAAGVAWGSCLVISVTQASRHSSERELAWRVLGIGAGIAGANATIRSAELFGLHTASPEAMSAMALVAGLLAAQGSWSAGCAGHTTPRAAAQIVVDCILIMACALVLLANVPLLGRLSWHQIPSIVALVVELAILLALSYDILLSRRPIRGEIASALLGGAIAQLAATILMAGTQGQSEHAAALAAGLNALRWGSVALAASRAATPPVQALERSQTRLWPNETAPRAVSVVAALLIGQSGAGAGLLMLLVALLALRETTLAAYKGWCWQIEQRAAEHRLLAMAGERDEVVVRLDALARLVHDQAGLINGLWSELHHLSKAGGAEHTRMLETHTEQLHSLNIQLRLKVRQEQPAPRAAQRVSAAECAAAAIAAIQNQACERRVGVELLVLAKATDICGSSVDLRRILDNLLSNAVKAAPWDGEVKVALLDDGLHPPGLTIAVSDNGRGLSTDELQHVFKPRVRFSEGDGLGLGLAIVPDLAEQLGGHCGVRSKPGGGSTFWVRLPRYDHPARTRQ
jgi:signal transduction histidine kinase